MAKAKKREKKSAPPPEQASGGQSGAAVKRSFARATRDLSQMLRGADAIYRMPWFALIGGPGTDKSELLIDCGLTARPGSPNTFGLEPPGANNWWFFNDAVVIDFADAHFGGVADGPAAGRAAKRGFFSRLFRRGGGSSGSTGWKAALEALRENRRKRPLDGLVLCVDARKLTAKTPDEKTLLVRRAEAIAERIFDVQQNLGVLVPIYVVLTHCEGIQGFSVYGKALPEPMRDQMFGWSSPHEPDTGYQHEWVDEAVGSLHEAVSVAQIELLPQVRSQTDRDELYLFPRALAGIAEPLKLFFDPIFKASSFKKSPPLRGVYLTGALADKASDQPKVPPIPGMAPPGPAPVVLPTGRPRFVRQLFSEKIFQEPGLARIDQEQSRVLNKKVRRARLALIIMSVVAVGGLVWQRWATANRVEEYAPIVTILKTHLDKTKYGSKDVGAGQGVEALEALADIQVKRLEMIPAPTSFFMDLTARANQCVAFVLGDGVGRPLRDELMRKADGLLPPALDVELAGDQHPVEVVAGSFQTRTPAQHVADLRAYADDVLTLNLNVKRYNNHEARDLGQVYQYLTGKDITETLESQADWYKKALRDIAGWPTLGWARYAGRSRTRALQLFEQMHGQLFRDHPLRAALAQLTELIDTIEQRKGRETHYQRLKAIYDAVGKVEALVIDDKANWMLAETFEPGPRYLELIEVLNGEAFPAIGDGGAGGETLPLGKWLDAENQRQFKDLRDAVWAARSSLGRFPILDRREGKVVLSTALEAVQRALKDFLDQPYVIEDEVQFQLDLQRDAGNRDEWNSDLIQQVLTWQKTFASYAGAQRPQVPPAINQALDTAARREFRDRVLQVTKLAAPDVAPGAAEATASGSWTAQRKDALKARIRNLADQYEAILKIIGFVDSVSSALNEAPDSQVFNALRDDSLSLLNQVNSILEEEKLYTIRSDNFSWWEGDQPPGVVAFGARDTNDMLARLGVQRKSITSLANEYARPVVDVMMRLGEPFSSDPDVEKWGKILSVLTDYEKKVPGNSLEELERFIEVELNKLQLASCGEQLEGHIDRYNRDDFFKDRKFLIGTAMGRRCNQILKTVTLQGYVDLQQFYTERLAGRFPYAGPDILAEVEATDVVQFYKRFDRYAGAFKALVKPGQGATGGLFGESTGEVLRFLQQVDNVRALFATILASEEDNPDLTLDLELDFRVNRDNEVNGNQIIEWWVQVADERIEFRDNKHTTQWKTNDAVSVCFRWAKDAMFLPAANQRAEHARVNGRTACYVFSGRWALMRLLSQHAATPADRGRRSFLRPHTLRFETETSLASAAANASSLLVTDTRVYLRVSVMTPGGKGAFRIPDFPRRAPELSAEFLKANGIIADAGGKGDF